MKRDRINGDLAAQMQGAYSGERVAFKQYLEKVKPHVGAIKADVMDFDDVLPRNPIAKAACRQEMYGEHQHAYTYTLKEALNSYLGRSQNATPDTIGKLRNAVERFLLHLKANDIPLREISKKQVIAYIEHLGIGYPEGTIRAHLSRLKSVWTHAYQMAEVDNPISPFCHHDLSPYRGEGSQRKQLFSSEQLQNILYEAPDSVRDLIRLGLFTGARLSELCGAHEEMIEGVRCMVIKKGKTAAAARIIPLPEQIKDIQLPLGLETKSAGRVFSRFKTEAITTDSSRTFHSLRVHFATAAQRARVVEFDAAMILGHKTGLTMSYGHYARHDVQCLQETIKVVAKQIEKEWLG
nr:phage integrase SAM-like domain-containing protein [Ferrimonas balearica]